MGLFDKKYCDICGDKIGLLGNRKLLDGNCCKNCAGKLSVWFSDRRQSTISDIKEQLAYREKNKEQVLAFRPSKKYGDDFKKLMIDEAQGKFTVATEAELKNGNPDILDLSAITDVIQDDRENQSEQKYKDKDGKMVSYEPKKYEYSYDFYIEIKVNHPYIDEMRFELNSFSVKLPRKPIGHQTVGIFKEYTKYVDMSNEVKDLLTGRNNNSAETAPSPENELCLRVDNKAFPALYVDKENGIDLDVMASITAKSHYIVTNNVLYMAAVQNNNFNHAYESSLLMGCIKAIDKNNGMSLKQVLANPMLMNAKILGEMEILARGFGLQVTDIQIEKFDISEADKAKISQITEQRTSMGTNRDAIPQGQVVGTMAAGGFVGGMGAGMSPQQMPQMTAPSQVGGQWECPACKAPNTGKFCEYCGTPRP